MKCNSFILKCFIQFACTNLDGSQKEGVFFQICFRKWGYPERGGIPSEKGGGGGFQPWMKLSILHTFELNTLRECRPYWLVLAELLRNLVCDWYNSEICF